MPNGLPKMNTRDCLDNTVPFGSGSGMFRVHSSDQLLAAVQGIRKDYKRKPVLAARPDSSAGLMSCSEAKLLSLTQRMPPPDARGEVGDLWGKMSWPTIQSNNEEWERRYERRAEELARKEKEYKKRLKNQWPLPEQRDSRPGAPEDTERVCDRAPPDVILSTSRHDFFPRSKEVLKEWRTGKNLDTCRPMDALYQYREATLRVKDVLGKRKSQFMTFTGADEMLRR